MSPVKLEELLLRHPHLEELARLHERIEQAMQSVEANPCVAEGPVPDDPLPLLLHHHLEPTFFAQSGDALRHLVTSLPADDLPAQFNQQCLLLHERLRQSPEEAARLIEEVVGAGPRACPSSGRTQGFAPTAAEDSLIRFLARTVLRKLLRPWREELELRLEHEDWSQPVCPLCGSGPAMAVLKSTRSGRQRLLVCGCCGMRWPWLRLGCAFCGNEEHCQLSMLELEDEVFRLDLCHQCKGFLKTCLSAGDEELLLADWTTLHLDALALAQGWQRRADSLYAL